MGTRLTVYLAVIGIVCLVPVLGLAQESRLDQLEKRVQHLEQRNSFGSAMETYALSGFSLLGLATFCGLWARSTGRDPWLWFVAGLVFSLFALIAVWAKHEGDKKAVKAADSGGPFERQREGGALSQNVRSA
jgi:hypothetical protein